jgi:hypothetical protein
LVAGGGAHGIEILTGSARYDVATTAQNESTAAARSSAAAILSPSVEKVRTDIRATPAEK